MAAELTTPDICTRQISGEELLQMGDIGPCELVEGRIVRMNPPGAEHGRIEALLIWHLMNVVTTHQNAHVLSGETGIYIRRNPDTVRGMDIAVISRQRLPTVADSGYLEVAPELVVEIVSPSDRWQDIEDKISDYFSIGVEQVWVVHPRQQAVYVYRSRSERAVFEREATLQGKGVLEGLRLTVAALF